jgi:RNA polymerase sigma-70 factor (ECF subfamily)
MFASKRGRSFREVDHGAYEAAHPARVNPSEIMEPAGVASMPPSTGEITRLLADLQKGNQEAASRLMPIIYRDLRRLAAAQLGRERSGHTFQSSDLVQELYLRLVKPGTGQWKDRTHFFRVAAHAMRQILVDYARKHKAKKRTGQWIRIELDESLGLLAGEASPLLALDEALTRLEKLAPRQSRIVEMRYFTGLSVQETAIAMGLGVTTVKSDWNLARAWLRRELESAL